MTTPNYRLEGHETYLMTHSVSDRKRLFNCANPIDALRCFRCTNFEACKLVDLKEHLKPGHTLLKSKEKIHECGSCFFQTHSRLLYLRHKLLNLCRKFKFETKSPQENQQFQSVRFQNDNSVLCPDKSITKCGTKSHVHNIPGNAMKLNDDHCQIEHNFGKGIETNKCSFKPVRHVVNDHAIKRNFKCDHCQLEAKSKQGLQSHIFHKHANLAEKHCFKCQHCAFKSKWKRSLQRHMDSQHVDKKTLNCDQCLFETKFKRCLQQHISWKHPSSPDNTSTRCWYRSETKQLLRNHIHGTHANKRKLPCDYCAYETESKSNLQFHISFTHTDEIRRFKCERCWFTSETRTNLKRHVEFTHREYDHRAFEAKYQESKNTLVPCDSQGRWR